MASEELIVEADIELLRRWNRLKQCLGTADDEEALDKLIEWAESFLVSRDE